MANDVFANNREISCKSGDGKAICAFPDTCFTPPENPATPPGVPVPYPNTGMDSDTTKGSKTVKISGKEVMLKNKSYFKTSYGDEAGCAAKKGVITSVNRGKVYFESWSMDVKFEGENVVRHLDITTHNHASTPPNAPPHMFTDEMAAANIADCQKDLETAKKACAKADPPDKCSKDCKEAQKCILWPKKLDKEVCCAPDTTGHHLIEVHCFSPTGLRGHPLQDLEKYRENDALCVCASESRADGTHGILHAVQGRIEGHYHQTGEEICRWVDPEGKGRENVSKWRYKHARDAGVRAHKIAFPHCKEECIKGQLDAYHKDECGIRENSPLRTDPGAEDRSAGDLSPAQKGLITKYLRG